MLSLYNIILGKKLSNCYTLNIALYGAETFRHYGK